MHVRTSPRFLALRALARYSSKHEHRAHGKSQPQRKRLLAPCKPSGDAHSELALQAGSARLQARKHFLLPETASDVCIARSSHRWHSPGRKPRGWQCHQPDKLVTKTAELRDATQRRATRPARRPRQRIENGATRCEAIAEGRQVPAVREAMRSPGANMSKHTCLQAATSEGIRLRSRSVSSENVDHRGQAG